MVKKHVAYDVHYFELLRVKGRILIHVVTDDGDFVTPYLSFIIVSADPHYEIKHAGEMRRTINFPDGKNPLILRITKNCLSLFDMKTVELMAFAYIGISETNSAIICYQLQNIEELTSSGDKWGEICASREWLERWT